MVKINFTHMNSCNCCFTDFLAKCEEEIIVNAALAPGTPYRWVITDKFDNKYDGEATAGADGELTIPVEELPAGLLTNYSGDFLLQIYDDSSCGHIKFKMTGEYDCLSFNVRGGTFVKNELGCVNSCIGAGSSNVLISFTDDDALSIDYTAYSASLGNNPLIQVYHEISPNIYHLVDVTINQVRVNGVLTTIEIENAGPATGYVLIS